VSSGNAAVPVPTIWLTLRISLEDTHFKKSLGSPWRSTHRAQSVLLWQ